MKGVFYLKNIISGKCEHSLSIKEIDISFKIDENKIADLRNSIQNQELLKETAILSIESSSLDKDSILHNAVQLSHLLSLALGCNLKFDRAIYIEEKLEKEEKREMLPFPNRGFPVIPTDYLDGFLNKTYENWMQLDDETKKQLRTAINFMNETREGWMDDRMLRISQSWELLANYWGIVGSIDSRLKDLKSRLKTFLRKWRKEDANEVIDEDTNITNKIMSSFTSKTLIEKLSTLASKYNLDLNEIELDFSNLKNYRDLIAHTGIMKMKNKTDENERNQNFELLYAAVFGLQIVILQFLKYDGPILYDERKVRPISDFILK